MTDNKLLHGKVCLVTGASRGIGRDTALAIARAGASVIVSSRSSEACKDVADEIAAAGGQALAAVADVTSAEDMEAVVSLAEKHFGRLDAAFNNAGDLFGFGPIASITPERFEKTLAVNLTGSFHALRAEIPALKRAGGGAIVVNAATAGLRGRAMLADYAAAKWGVVGLTLSTALETAPHNIRVNAVAPGLIGTESWNRMMGDSASNMASKVPLGRIGNGTEVADAVVWLLSDSARYVTGTVLPIDGGMMAG